MSPQPVLKTIRRAEYAELIALFFLQGAASGMWLVPLSAMLDAHGGTIRLTDSAEGTAFELTIPLADALTS